MSTLEQATFSLFPDDLEHVFSRTRDVWEELRGQRIFITGGTGFFGKWLLESFAYANEKLELKSELVVLSRNPQRFLASMPHLDRNLGIRLHPGDVRSFPFPSGNFSHVIHGATDASARLNESSPLAMFDVIAAGTHRVLDFAASCGAKKLLLMSSGAVYGRQPATMPQVPEEYMGGPDPLSTSSAYAEGKRVAEMMCAVAHKSRHIRVLIARCFAFVGPYLPLDLHFAIGNFIGDALRGNPVVVRGDGGTKRSYLYAADLATWLWTILLRGEHCRPYNVGSDQAWSILDVAQAVAELPSHSVGVRLDGRVNSAEQPSCYVPSIERARRELGLDITTDFRSAIANTFRWHQQTNGFLDQQDE
jgi:dTDP-glucose 4,6-dehydratase